jgi:hypothetical protein
MRVADSTQSTPHIVEMTIRGILHLAVSFLLGAGVGSGTDTGTARPFTAACASLRTAPLPRMGRTRASAPQSAQRQARAVGSVVDHVSAAAASSAAACALADKARSQKLQAISGPCSSSVRQIVGCSVPF